MATDRISVRLDAETIKFLEQVGGEGRGAISRGVARVIEFARLMPRTFRGFRCYKRPVAWAIVDKFASLEMPEGARLEETDQCAENA